MLTKHRTVLITDVDVRPHRGRISPKLTVKMLPFLMKVGGENACAVRTRPPGQLPNDSSV